MHLIIFVEIFVPFKICSRRGLVDRDQNDLGSCPALIPTGRETLGKSPNLSNWDRSHRAEAMKGDSALRGPVKMEYYRCLDLGGQFQM